MARWWRDLAWTAFERLDPAATVAILPVAAVEQHGPHLPVGVDDFVNEGVVAAAMPMMPDSVLVLPPSYVGKSNEHLAYPGTLTLTAGTLIRVWTEIGECVARAGVRKFLVLNSHAGSRRSWTSWRVTCGFGWGCSRWRPTYPGCTASVGFSPPRKPGTASTRGLRKPPKCCICGQAWCKRRRARTLRRGR